ncbi:MAG: hypothetical protein ACRDC6_28120, partial [Shewanella sp.]
MAKTIDRYQPWAVAHLFSANARLRCANRAYVIALLPLFVIEATMLRPLLTTDLDAAVELWYQASV